MPDAKCKRVVHADIAMTPPPAGLQPPSGAVVTTSAAKVALNLLAIDTPLKTVAGVVATSESSAWRASSSTLSSTTAKRG